jgi:KaiC/GvpD/RAD55 family RecA-like ATPase
MDFTGKWRDCFGTPAPMGSWIIYGTSGSGKTSFALQLAKYLTGFRRVVYWTLEQGNTQSFQRAWRREKMGECGGNIIAADDEETFTTIADKMTAKRGREILVVDSLTPLRAQNFNVRGYNSFRQRMKDKLTIWLSHEKDGLPDTAVGDYILKLADLKMHVEGFKVFTNTRAGKGLEDYVIWEEGATLYHTEKL